MSSISNFAVNIYIARTLGAVQYGAFGLAYVTYSFALNASRGLATDPLLVRFSGTDLPAWRRAVGRLHRDGRDRRPGHRGRRPGHRPLLHGTARLAFLALGLTLPAAAAPGQLAVLVLRARARAARPSSTTRSGP